MECFGDGKKKGSRGTGLYYMLNIQFNEVDANDFKPDRLHRNHEANSNNSINSCSEMAAFVLEKITKDSYGTYYLLWKQVVQVLH
jgi:hypothetical protein